VSLFSRMLNATLAEIHDDIKALIQKGVDH